MEVHHIKPHFVSLQNLNEVIRQHKDLALSDEAVKVIEECRNYIDATMKTRKDPVYGINTGFGSLCDVKINDSQLEELQTNLVMSHACGTGDEAPSEIVKLMLLLKAKGLSYGKSGVQKITVERLITFYNEDCIPVVYQLGSLGASGDLAPLAHLSLPLLGMGEVYLKGERMESAEALEILGLEPITLKSKEGLALLNGTQFMSAFGTWAVLKAKKLSYLADLIGAISLEGFDGRPEAFDELLHLIRPHNGQIQTAKNIREFLEGSEIISSPKKHVQDPYSFRCMPQVHGASKDAIAYVEKVMETEVNSVTDNPTVFQEDDKILSGGNFHGQPLAIAMDFMAIALAELGSISERRTYQLIHGYRDLNPFLVAEPGLNSGFMIPQYTAASIVSQNKQLATPASVDSIESSNGQEDHVSMGANAATKLYQVVNNLERILAIELMNASQALHFREGKSSEFIEAFVDSYRQEVPVVTEDRILHYDIEASIDFIQSLDLDPELIF
jgi:histidine ammonia-lyase